MTHVTCKLTAKNRDQLRNSTLGNRVSAAFSFFYLCPAQFCRAGQLATADTCSSGDAPIQSSSPSNSESSSGSDISSESGVFSGDDVDEYAALPTSSDTSLDRFRRVCTTLPLPTSSDISLDRFRRVCTKLPCRHHPTSVLIGSGVFAPRCLADIIRRQS